MQGETRTHIHTKNIFILLIKRKQYIIHGIDESARWIDLIDR